MGDKLDLAQIATAALQARGIDPEGLVGLVDGANPPTLRIFGGSRVDGVVEPYLDCRVVGTGTVEFNYGAIGAGALDVPHFDVRGRVLTTVYNELLSRGPYAPLPDGPAD
jgi:hypothetical protein